MPLERDRLVLEHMPLAQRIAWTIARAHVDEDIIADAYLGLVKAANHPSHPNFRLYAAGRIRAEVIDGLRRRGPLFPSDWKRRVLVERTQFDLAQRTGRMPSDTELAGDLGLSLRELSECLACLDRVDALSLDEPLLLCDCDDQDLTLHDVTPAVEDTKQMSEDDRNLLVRCVAELPWNERTAITLRFWQDMYEWEIGQLLGVSESRVSKLIAAGLKRLRARMMPVPG